MRKILFSVLVLAFYFLGSDASIAGDMAAVEETINGIFKPIMEPISSVIIGAGIRFLDAGGIDIVSGLKSEQEMGAGITLPFIVIWLFVGALSFTIYMGFINLRGFKQSLRIVSGRYDNPNDPGEVTHFQALTAALSGTVGLGNISGVAIALTIGGPGATFWMIVLGLLGMTSKFVECTLGVKYRKIDENGEISGGPMYYLSRGLANHGKAKLGKFMGALSAILIIGGALGSGALFQMNQASQTVTDISERLMGADQGSLSVYGWIVGIGLAGLVAMVIVGGIKQITHVTEKLVPFMAILYVSCALVVIGINIEHVPAAFAAIFAGAFSPDGVTGGFIGVLVQGMRRGTFSNEAGLGSAAIAHASAKTKEPIAEGLVALMEPFVDTVVVCTITALVILVTDSHINPGSANGVTLTSNAFASVVDWFPYLLSIAIVLFAFSTSITWFYYGQRSFFYLLGETKHIDHIYKVAFMVCIVVGASMQLGPVMDFADAMLLSMAIPNLVGLYIMAPDVKAMLKSYFHRLNTGEIKPYKEG